MQSSMSTFLLPSKLKSFLVLTPIKSKYQMMKASYAIFVYVIWQENPLVIDWFKLTVPLQFLREIDFYKLSISKIAFLAIFWALKMDFVKFENSQRIEMLPKSKIPNLWISVILNLANSEYQMLPIWQFQRSRSLEFGKIPNLYDCWNQTKSNLRAQKVAKMAIFQIENL